MLIMSSSVLLYELSEHGTGWRVEQQVDDASDGWGRSRDLPAPAPAEATAAVVAQDGVDGTTLAAAGSPVMPSTSEAVLAALRRFDVSTLRRLARAHPRFASRMQRLHDVSLLVRGLRLIPATADAKLPERHPASVAARHRVATAVGVARRMVPLSAVTLATGAAGRATWALRVPPPV